MLRFFAVLVLPFAMFFFVFFERLFLAFSWTGSAFSSSLIPPSSSSSSSRSNNSTSSSSSSLSKEGNCLRFLVDCFLADLGGRTRGFRGVHAVFLEAVAGSSSESLSSLTVFLRRLAAGVTPLRDRVDFPLNSKVKLVARAKQIVKLIAQLT